MLLSATTLFAQGITPPAGMSSQDKAAPEWYYSQNVTPAGTESTVALKLNLEDGWHVNSNRPSLDFLIGTELSVDPKEGFVLLDTGYPPSTSYNFDFAPEPVDVFEGEAPIFLTFSVDPSVAPGTYQLPATLTLQACNNEVCLAPSTIDLTIDLEVTAEGTGYRAENEALFAGYDQQSRSITDALTASGSGEIAALFESLGIFWALAGIFLIGLALNLTPCVYPMLSITVSLFGSKKGEESRIGHSFSMAFIYVMGIVTMYSVLGVAAAYTGALFGSWLQSPWVLGGIGLLILLLALSMFGLYELQPPSSMMQKLSGAQQKTTGVAGHYFSGLVVGVFAAPCIGPPIIALLAFVGSQGDPLFGFLLFFVMAFGLGFPYLILGTFSGLLSRLPRSGIWMVWVKKLFGVVLVGVAAFYLALAVAPAYTLHSIVVILVLGGLYLGFLEKTPNITTLFRSIRWGTAVIALVVAGMIAQNLMKEGVTWESYTESRYQEAIDNGNPIMIDFYADWCIPCLELERVTFTDPDVIEDSHQFVRLKVDMTQYESDENRQLRESFDISGVPTIVFINASGEEVDDARVVGFMRPDRFLERMEMVNSE